MYSPTKTMTKLVRQAVRDFNLIEPGDRVAVGLSGGKDSFLLLQALKQLALGDDMDFELFPIHLDQHQPGFDRQTFEATLDLLGSTCEVVSENTHDIVQQQLKPGQIPCAICSRLRRGILNEYCKAQGYNKLAIGHHLDDALETFLLNLFYGRSLNPLKPATPSKQDVTTIRPLILIEERKIEAWVAMVDLPVVACPVCDTFPRSKRREVKTMVDGMLNVHHELHASVRSALYGEASHPLLEDLGV